MNKRDVEKAMADHFKKAALRAPDLIAESRFDMVERMFAVAIDRTNKAMKELSDGLDRGGVGYGLVHEAAATMAAVTMITSALGSYELEPGREEPMTAGEMLAVARRVCDDVMALMEINVPWFLESASEVRARKARGGSDADVAMAALERMLRGGRTDG